MTTTECIMCGHIILSKRSGNKTKQYCGTNKQIGSCAYKRRQQHDFSRKILLQDKTLKNYLNNIGGRTIDDLERDNNGKLFVLMWSGIIHAPVRFYLPQHLQ